MRKRWEIMAHPESSDEFAVRMAEEMNRDRMRFWTRSGAARWSAKIRELGLPVMLWVQESGRDE